MKRTLSSIRSEIAEKDKAIENVKKRTKELQNEIVGLEKEIDRLRAERQNRIFDDVFKNYDKELDDEIMRKKENERISTEIQESVYVDILD